MKFEAIGWHIRSYFIFQYSLAFKIASLGRINVELVKAQALGLCTLINVALAISIYGFSSAVLGATGLGGDFYWFIVIAILCLWFIRLAVGAHYDTGEFAGSRRHYIIYSLIVIASIGLSFWLLVNTKALMRVNRKALGQQSELMK